MTDLQARIAALDPQKRALLETRMATLVATRTSRDDDRIRPRDRSRPAPLSFAQQREWALERFRAANNISGALRLVGVLDLQQLSEILTEVLERHEVLRSTIEIRDRLPVQVVHPVTPVPVPEVDLSGLSPHEQREEIRRRYQEETARPFPGDARQRLRVQLLHLADDEHVALLTTHHAASDGWSVAILVQELAALHAARHTRGGRPLPPPPIQFADYAAWQRERLDERWMAVELDHWRRELEDMPPRLALPADRPYPARPTFAGAHHVRRLPREQALELHAFIEREGVSTSMVLLAACSVMLHRYTLQDDLVFGSAVTGRNRIETERLIGCFANVLPLRMRVAPSQRLQDVLRQALDVSSAAYEHIDLPFGRLVEELVPNRESSPTPLVQMMINVLTAPGETLRGSASALEVPGLRIVPEPMAPGHVVVDLSLNAETRGDAVTLQWHYSTERFDEPTIVQIAEQFEHVLAQFVHAPDTTVGELTLLEARPTAPRQGAVRPGAGEPDVLSAFARQVDLGPDAPAVVGEGVELSYEELDRRANRVARQLVDRGGGGQAPVAVLAETSPSLAVAALGVLKAGGTPLVLDPEDPPEVARSLVRQAGARPLLATHALAALAAQVGPADDPAPPVILDDAAPESDGARFPDHATPPRADVAAAALDVARRLQLGAGDRVLSLVAPPGGLLGEGLLPVWLTGGCVILPGADGGPADLVRRERVTVLRLSAHDWRRWVQALRGDASSLPRSLRLVVVDGGEVDGRDDDGGPLPTVAVRVLDARSAQVPDREAGRGHDRSTRSVG